VTFALFLGFVVAGGGDYGPYGKNYYNSAGGENKGGADQISNAKYRKNRLMAHQNAAQYRRNNGHLNNIHKANAKRSQVLFHNNNANAIHQLLNQINAKNSNVKFNQAQGLNRAKYNRLHVNAAQFGTMNAQAHNAVKQNQIHSRNGNMKKVNSYANHAEFDDFADADRGYGGKGVKGYGGGGPKNVGSRRHMQHHQFGNNLLKGDFNEFNGGNFDKVNNWHVNKRNQNLGFDQVHAQYDRAGHNVNYQNHLNNFNKRNLMNLQNHQNAVNYANNNQRMAALNKNEMNRNMAAQNMKNAAFNQGNVNQAAQRGQHSYVNNYRRGKNLGNKLV